MNLSKRIKLISDELSKYDTSDKKISKKIPFIILDKNKCYSNKDIKDNPSIDILLLEFSD